jgi:hypothetical protein
MLSSLCYRLVMSKLLLLLILCFTLSHTTVQAQIFRSLPQQGERGTLGQNQALPEVQIGSRSLRLAPGAIIYDQNNRSIVHSQLPTDADVFYTTDSKGEIQRIYILTEQEKARLDQSRSR